METRKPGGAATKEHRTVSRVAAILEAAAARPDGITLRELAALLQAPKSSLHGLLRGLVMVGYLFDRNDHYVISPGLAALLSPPRGQTLEQLARPHMTRLRDTFDESVMLGVETGDSIVYIATVESRQPVRYSAPLHERRLLHPSSMGKLYLADLTAERLADYVRARDFDAPRTDRLRRELDEVRRTRLGYNREETFADVTAVAAGVRDRDGVLVGCISIAGPTLRMSAALDEIAAATLATADAISVDVNRSMLYGAALPRTAATGLVQEQQLP